MNDELTMSTISSVEIYTDGGCRNNPGIGAWAFVVIADGVEAARFSGVKECTTNNEMELTAMLEAERWLEANAGDCNDITIYSDSQYVVNTMLIWYDSYMRTNKWMKKKNIGLIQEIMTLYNNSNRSYKIIWIKGHANNKYNIQVDKLVNEAMDNIR